MSAEQETPFLAVRNLTMRYDETLIQRDLDFNIPRGKVFIVMGPSGCGKTTLMRHMVGLERPAEGEVLYQGISLWDADPGTRNTILRRCGVLYQSSALWSSMTLAENVAMPLEQFTDLSAGQIEEVVSVKLALVGLSGFEDFNPAELSGGMQKRAALARAMALDPEILFFDEPTGGLDPVSARRMDQLILQLRDGLGTTIIAVTHDLATILDIGDDSVFLDGERQTMVARGNPQHLREECEDEKVRAFLNWGETEDGADG